MNNRNKPVIEDILLTEEQETELRLVLNSPYAARSKIQAIRKIAGGNCCECGSVPVKRVGVDISDSDGEGILIEYYCGKCYEKWFTKLRSTNGKDETIAVRGK